VKYASGAWSSSASADGHRSIIGSSEAIASMLEELDRVAHTDARVLITGESGVGKELVASQIHAGSGRVAAPFVAVNCAGMPETLLESELFGHVKGSFTGADRDRAGKFESAHTGTLFLDEVGDMTLRMQGLLLRVLETGEVQKVGADRPSSRIHTRVVSATHRNLPELIQQRLFREDLYYRLNVIHIHVPPLRERQSDIPMLATHFLRRIVGDRVQFSPDALAALEAWTWPGNVRQLDNFVQRLAVLVRTGVITVNDLPPEIVGTPRPAPPVPISEAPDRRRTVSHVLYERMIAGESFWDAVHEPYIARDIRKSDVRAVVQKGLESTRGNYRVLTRLFNIPPGQYKRFLNFLRKHECLLPYREFR
jgi:two-component system, NtrC family, response regulator